MTKPAAYLTVPSGTPSTPCRGCGAPMYFIKSAVALGKYVPVDCAADERCAVPTALEDGRGVNHFTNCPERDRFRRPR